MLTDLQLEDLAMTLLIPASVGPIRCWTIKDTRLTCTEHANLISSGMKRHDNVCFQRDHRRRDRS